MSEEEISAIHDEAVEAAEQSWPGKVVTNPYPRVDERAEIWEFAFRNAIANIWH